jgi:hypothetical protein
VIQVWGPHERNDLETMTRIARPFMPARPADAPTEPDYSTPGVLEDIATRVGLAPEQGFNSGWGFQFADDDTLTRALTAPAGIAQLVGPEREPEYAQALIDGLAPYRRPDGSYRLHNDYRFLIARA